MGAVSSRITLIAACMGSPHITCASKRGTKRQYYLCEDSAHEKCRASCKSCDKRQVGTYLPTSMGHYDA